MRTRFPIALLICLVAVLTLRPAPRPQANPPAVPALRTLIVGGGPEPDYNQVAIESNVRYVRRLLPADAPLRTLFADGDPSSRIVLYTDDKGHDHFRATTLNHIDGPSRLTSFRHAFQSLTSQNTNTPLLLYFTGHGSPGDRDYDNNDYDLWGNDTLSVTHLAAFLEDLPPGAPVTVVMVQCFSGAFGNLLWKEGDPQGAPINLDLCGFFASAATREAAGCTSEVDEADYHDFTSYFFSALSGVSRLGKPITGADYNHDGSVGMNEAFCYALIHDISIDTPVCTSDVFLRRYVPVDRDRTLFATSYSQTLSWAQPAQHAALEALSSQLHLTGDNRFVGAYTQFKRRVDREGSETEEEQTARWTRFIRLAKSVILAHRLQASGDASLKARYAVLLAAEARNPLPSAQTRHNARY